MPIQEKFQEMCQKFLVVLQEVYCLYLKIKFNLIKKKLNYKSGEIDRKTNASCVFINLRQRDINISSFKIHS